VEKAVERAVERAVEKTQEKTVDGGISISDALITEKDLDVQANVC
jgi:hypothetical protein